MTKIFLALVGTAAISLGGAIVHEANAAPPPSGSRAPTTPHRQVEKPRQPPTHETARKTPNLTNKQLTPTTPPAQVIPSNLPKQLEQSLPNKVINGPGPTVKDFQGTNTPPPAQPAPGLDLGKVGSPSATPERTRLPGEKERPFSPQVEDTNSRSTTPPPAAGGVKLTAPVPGG